jgi:hypothetical protein
VSLRRSEWPDVGDVALVVSVALFLGGVTSGERLLVYVATVLTISGAIYYRVERYLTARAAAAQLETTSTQMETVASQVQTLADAIARVEHTP